MFASGCKLGRQQSTNNSAGTPQVSNGLSGDQTEAKSLLEKGKQLYRDDQDTDAVAALEATGTFRDVQPREQSRKDDGLLEVVIEGIYSAAPNPVEKPGE